MSIIRERSRDVFAEADAAHAAGDDRAAKEAEQEAEALFAQEDAERDLEDAEMEAEASRRDAEADAEAYDLWEAHQAEGGEFGYQGEGE